jgi:DNA-binding response OmpR family regulator
MLLPANWEGVVCSLPEDAASLAGSFDAVLWDLPLGDADNLALAVGLRKAGYRGALLIVSEDRSRPTVLKCLEAGVNYYLLKPLDATNLLDKLAKLQAAAAPPRNEPVTRVVRAWARVWRWWLRRALTPPRAMPKGRARPVRARSARGAQASTASPCHRRCREFAPVASPPPAPR